MSEKELAPKLKEIFDEQTIAEQLPISLDKTYGFSIIENDRVIAGVTAKQTYETLYIQLLAVDASHRGKRLGSQLLEKMEQLALEKKITAISLTTKSYQSLDFYLKYGYEVFGELKDYPMKGITKYYLVKYL